MDLQGQSEYIAFVDECGDHSLTKIDRDFPVHDKRKNIVGIQLADLCAHPSARHILKPDQPNRAYDVVRRHLHDGGGRQRGWKVFP